MNAQALLDLCRINEEAEGFYLGDWYGPSRQTACGTIGCLVGNYFQEKAAENERTITSAFLDGRNIFYYSPDDGWWEYAAGEFGLTKRELDFLFGRYDTVRGRWGYPLIPVDRLLFDREAAIRRVRKLIYWKLKRREFMYEEDGRVKESARRMEGDRNFTSQVLAMV